MHEKKYISPLTEPETDPQSNKRLRKTGEYNTQLVSLLADTRLLVEPTVTNEVPITIITQPNGYQISNYNIQPHLSVSLGKNVNGRSCFFLCLNLTHIIEKDLLVEIEVFTMQTISFGSKVAPIVTSANR